MIKSIKINNFKELQNEIHLDFYNHKQFNMLFGENESGKSTILDALKQFEIIFKKGFIGFKDQINNQTSYMFELEILKKIYLFDLQIDFKRKEIIKEVLKVIKNNEEIMLYSRINHDVTVSTHLEKLFDEFDFMRLQTYIYDLRYDRKNLILSNIYNKDFSESNLTMFLSRIGDNLSHINYIDLDTEITFFNSNEMSYYPKVLANINKLFPKVKALSYKEIDLDDLRLKLNRHYYDHFIDLYRNEMMFTEQDVIFVSCFKSFYKLTGKTLETLRVYEVLVEIDDNKFNLNEVGSGLRKSILLFMILLRKKKEAIYLVENFNTSIDYHKVLNLVDLLRSDFKEKSSSMISTVNDYMLFDNKLFNFNEILYVKKNNNQTLFSYLDRLNIRKDKKILNLIIDRSIEELIEKENQNT